MLDAAMSRSYSASPDESFFTGGGLHRFENFDPKDNSRVTTVREAFQRSINLVFIRLMRDVVDHSTFRREELAGILEDVHHPGRGAYLARFADWEGRKFLRKFYTELHGASVDETLRNVVRRRAASPRRHPWKSGSPAISPSIPTQIFVPCSRRAPRHARTRTTGSSRRRSVPHRIERSRSCLEADAFADIHASWRRQGYPFQSLVPSYATAIGSSGDNPAALSALMGDQAIATSKAGSQSSDDREPRAWSVMLKRVDGEWAINSIQSS